MVSTPAIDQDAATMAIEGFLREHAPPAHRDGIGPATRILDGGLLDSLGILRLMTFLGDQIGVEIEDEDFVPEHFETVESLARFAVAKLARAA